MKSSTRPPCSLDRKLVSCAESGSLPMVRSLLSRGARADFQDSLALLIAVRNGHVECANALIPFSDALGINHALLEAAMRGHSECVSLLIPVSDTMLHGSQALRRAAAHGHPECVKLLIAVSNPKDNRSMALCWAAGAGHADCAMLLIPFSEPLRDDMRPFEMAAHNGHANVVAAMLAHEPALIDLIDSDQYMREAKARGHAELAVFLLSAAELRGLSASTPLGRHPASAAPATRL